MNNNQKISQHIKFGLITVILLIVGGCKWVFAQKDIYEVKKVSDGDTLSIIDNNQSFTVRFACMDAPEIAHTNAEKQSQKAVDKNQFAWGDKAKIRLQDLIKQGGDRVRLTVTDIDRYGRKVSEVRLPNNTLVQEVLIREGLAKVYKPYLKNCPSANIVQQAETEAKQGKKGVWGDNKFVDPWEYRRTNKKED